MKRAAILLTLALAGKTTADDLRLNAKALFERAATENVRLMTDDRAIELDRGVLIEDDGPAAGYSYLPNEERLSEQVRVKKLLVLADPAASAAHLLVGPGGDLKAIMNGRPVELKASRRAGQYWQAYEIPPNVLRAGTNELVLYGDGRVWIARAEDFAAGSIERPQHPNRSARSADGGKTWDHDRLGRNGNIDGEYYVRLFLDQFQTAGSLTLPVIDAGNLAGKAIGPPCRRVRSATITTSVVAGASGRAVVKLRSGRTATPDPAWSAWSDVPAGGKIAAPVGRYIQIKIQLLTSDAAQSPRLTGLTVTADAESSDDWTDRVTVREFKNADIVRTSIPFAYEAFVHPQLKELRSAFRLDEVVKGAANELELIERLARWSAERWDKGRLRDGYPPWSALEILKAHADGAPVGGFCQQYNVVFLQACESFGIPGRAVSISTGDNEVQIRGGGHEVVELWSNQFAKWIYIDGNMAWYAVDEKARVPLSLWELRERQMSALEGKAYPPIRIVELREGKKRWAGLAEWPPFLELRLIPRSDFLARKAPLPLNQGMRGWFWTGHHVWTDQKYQASLLYGRRVSDRKNWEWTLNQSRLTLEADEENVIRVHVDTETPGLETHLAAIDGGDAKSVGAEFTWKLHAGTNRLEVRPRNNAGRKGIVSAVVLDVR